MLSLWCWTCRWTRNTVTDERTSFYNVFGCYFGGHILSAQLQGTSKGSMVRVVLAFLTIAHACSGLVAVPRSPLLHHVAVAPPAGTRPAGAPRCSDRTTDTPTQSALTYGAIGAGLVANPIMWWSLFTLKTTGCGLPAGPFGLLGAAEGVSYLVVVGFVGAALYKKATTGSGLPAGPAGLLGAAEGLSFLSVAAGLAVLGFQLADYGYLPEAVPVEGGTCSSI